MAEQNVLTGDIAVLGQIISDLKEHNDKTERLEKLTETMRDLSKSIEVSEREIRDETEAKVKSGMNSICEGYDQTIAVDRAKLKTIQYEREKAKLAGVKERIEKETADIRQENTTLKEQIREAFKLEQIPMYCSSRIYLALFQTRGAGDAIFYAVSLLIPYLLIPAGFYFIPGFPAWGYILYYFLMGTAGLSFYRFVYEKTMVGHADTITAARKTKVQIKSNQKRMKKIEKSIRTDKNEEMYGLEKYDFQMNELYDDISRIEEEKKKALNEFEKTAKPDIIAEIDGRYRSRVNLMKSELEKKREENLKLEGLVKEQRIYISSNYEAYLGKAFMNQDKLQELYTIMKSGAAETVAQALAAYKDRH